MDSRGMGQSDVDAEARAKPAINGYTPEPSATTKDDRVDNIFLFYPNLIGKKDPGWMAVISSLCSTLKFRQVIRGSSLRLPHFITCHYILVPARFSTVSHAFWTLWMALRRDGSTKPLVLVLCSTW